MSESTYKMLLAALERDVRECDTPEKARLLLQGEGLLDETGRLAPMYREVREVTCQ